MVSFTDVSRDARSPAQQGNADVPPPTTIVLVHGAFVDGSGWRAVHDRLKISGYRVVVVQNAIQSLEDDVANTRRAIAAAAGDVILVGHSYGGAVISEAGNDPKVTALVYVAAFVADAGESVKTLTASSDPGASKPPFVPTEDGHVLFDPASFPQAFGHDLPPETSGFMAAALKPWAIASMTGKVTCAAWRSKPSWYVIATDDKLVQPDLQRRMAIKADAHIVEAAGSHAIYMTQADVIATTIALAATSTKSSPIAHEDNPIC